MTANLPSSTDSGLSRFHSEPLASFDASQALHERWKRKLHRIITTLERYDNQRAMRMLMELEADIKELIDLGKGSDV